MSDAYDNAAYYDTAEPEILTHESPEEAIEAFVDARHFGPDALEDIRAHGPITVLAYNREDVSDDWIAEQGKQAAGRFLEAFDESYGPHDGDRASDTEVSVLAKALARWLRPWIDENLTVWKCEAVGKRTYSVDEVLAIMRKHAPEWFQKESTSCDLMDCQ